MQKTKASPQPLFVLQCWLLQCVLSLPKYRSHWMIKTPGFLWYHSSLALQSLGIAGSALTAASPAHPTGSLPCSALYLLALPCFSSLHSGHLTLHYIFTCFLFVSFTRMRAGTLPALLALYSQSQDLGLVFGGCLRATSWWSESLLFTSHPFGIGHAERDSHKHGKSYYKWNLSASERISEDQVTVGQCLYTAV